MPSYVDVSAEDENEFEQRRPSMRVCLPVKLQRKIADLEQFTGRKRDAIIAEAVEQGLAVMAIAEEVSDAA